MRLGLAVAALVALVDQLAKAWVLDLFAGTEGGTRVVTVAPVFNLVLTWNRGMSFGLFNNDATLNTAIFSLLALVIVGALLTWLRRNSETVLAIAIGLVIGGAIGNVADRLSRGAVVDFLDFHLGSYHWFTFNLADAAISVGVAVMVIDSLLRRREARY